MTGNKQTMIASANRGLLGGTRGAPSIPTVALLAAVHASLAGEPVAAPEHDTGPPYNAIVEAGQT